MFFGLADITFANMNQIRKDSFCRKIGGEIYVWSMGVECGPCSGSAIQPQFFIGETARLCVSEYPPPFETNATFGRSMGSEH